MSSDSLIEIKNLGKCYQIYDKPRDRLLQMVLRKRKQLFREFWAVRDLDLDIQQGEVIGIIGSNGAGKSTLLQLVCGTLAPTTGFIKVRGRVAALLELGAGFNPEFTGRENVYLSATVNGLTPAEIKDRFEDIVSFSGIEDFIDQPVKTYSSGMYVRLAFSIAIHVDPDILIIDEALSVGDGAFSRKSFDRIMAMKSSGKTILFCSHSLYHVEAFCDRVLWLDKGQCVLKGLPSEVVRRYGESLAGECQNLSPVEHLKQSITDGADPASLSAQQNTESSESPQAPNYTLSGQGKIISVSVLVDGNEIRNQFSCGGTNELIVKSRFYVDPSLPEPVVGVTIDYTNIVTLCSVVSRSDGVEISRDEKGYGCFAIKFSQLNLRKGEYWINVYLSCENAFHFYDVALRVATISINDSYVEPGLIKLPHSWINYEDDTADNSSDLLTIPWGHAIEVDKTDSLGLKDDVLSFEPLETDLCQKLIEPGDRILDIGANIGYYALLFSHLTGSDGRVIAVEPDRENYSILARNISRNGLDNIVKAHQLALGDKSVTGRLYHAENKGMHRLYSSVCCGSQYSEVQVIPGDDLETAPLDFIKIDIEGYEPFALSGLDKTIKKSPNLKILSEFSPLSIIEAGYSPVDYILEMQHAGFQAVAVEGNKWVNVDLPSLIAGLRKIQIRQAEDFIRQFKQGESVESICQKTSIFLKELGYGRPLFENLLFFTSSTSHAVKEKLNIS